MLTLEVDELQRKRSHLDDVPLHLSRIREGSLPQIRHQSVGAKHPDGNEDSVQPESRVIIPGHLDPQIGTYRTDAPTTSWVAVQIAVTIAASLNMPGETVYLSVLPSLSGMPVEIRLGQLLQIQKGAYGSTEGPTLRFLRARERLTGPVCLTELRCARAVFAKHDAGVR